MTNCFFCDEFLKSMIKKEEDIYGSDEELDEVFENSMIIAARSIFLFGKGLRNPDNIESSEIHVLHALGNLIGIAIIGNLTSKYAKKDLDNNENLIDYIPAMNDLIKKKAEASMIQILEGTFFIENKELFLKKIKEISMGKNLAIQAFDADKLAGKEHLTFAIEKAMNSFKKGTNVANDLAKEIMLYAAGTRQINRAVKIGVHDGWNNIAIVAVGDMIDLSALSKITKCNVLQYSESKNSALMDIFNITEEEIEAVGADKIPELVLERIALVDVMK